MSKIQIPSIQSQPAIAILGDVVDLTPSDGRFSYSYAAPTKPGGSSAAFSGATITPDQSGTYGLTVTANADVRAITLYVFTTAVRDSLKTRTNDPIARDDQTIRSILRSLAQVLSPTDVTAWNSGTWPAVAGNLARFGG